jgi:phosphoglycerate dehydrogenase-like enzyme
MTFVRIATAGDEELADRLRGFPIIVPIRERTKFTASPFELTIALMLALARQIPREDRAMREGKWLTTIGVELAGKTLGILGLGRLGTQVAGAARLFNMRLLAVGLTLVDEAALVDALRGRRIVGAALDVFETEPLPADHPLRSLDNAVLSAHLGYVTAESYHLFFTQAIENIVRYLHGELPLRTLNAEVLA